MNQKQKYCVIGDHLVPRLWKSNPPACQNCWQRFKHKHPEKPKPKPKPAIRDLTTGLNVWFADQIMVMPRYCENCGEYLNPNAPWGARAYVCHIIPKRTFKSVMMHPQNRWFGCIHCHTDYDNYRNVQQMRVFPVIIERFREFRDLITEPNELPVFLQDLC